MISLGVHFAVRVLGSVFVSLGCFQFCVWGVSLSGTHSDGRGREMTPSGACCRCGVLEKERVLIVNPLRVLRRQDHTHVPEESALENSRETKHTQQFTPRGVPRENRPIVESKVYRHFFCFPAGKSASTKCRVPPCVGVWVFSRKYGS